MDAWRTGEMVGAPEATTLALTDDGLFMEALQISEVALMGNVECAEPMHLECFCPPTRMVS
jgi:hypothetical protein